MNIVTKEQLAATLLEKVFADLYAEWEEMRSFDQENPSDTFDEYVYNNRHSLGGSLYQYVGAAFGDCDDMMDDVKGY